MSARWRTLALVFLLSFAVPVASAHAAVGAYGEPTFTKGTANTWWFSYQSTAASGHTYSVCAGLIVGVTVIVNDGCHTETGAGDFWVSHSGLASGTAYEECAYGEIDGTPISGDGGCQTTTMDNSSPAAATGVNGTDEFTDSPVVHLAINYQDSISEPWPGGSTFDCWRKGDSITTSTGCQNAPNAADQFQFDPGCSSPLSANTNAFARTGWTCDYDLTQLSGLSDGKWSYCVIETDDAMPDNPSNHNQFVATSDQANRSPDTPGNCGSITLDRTAPSVSVTPSTTTPQIGQLVSFSASAQDSLSGPDGTYAWTYGDNTPAGSGASPTHTFTQAGTYDVTVTTHDQAGNAGTATARIAVAGGGPVIEQATPTPTPTPGGGGATGSAHGTTGASALQHMAVTLAYLFKAHPKNTKFSSLSVKGIPHGATVKVTCSGGGCPAKLKHGYTITAASATLKLGSYLKKSLSTSAVITVSASKAGWITTVKKLKPRPSKSPMVTTSCTTPGAHPAPVACS